MYIPCTYIYDANAIIIRPMKTRTDESTLAAFQDIYEHLKQRKLKPQIHIIDNECSTTFKSFVQLNETTLQLVDPDLHKVNTAKRAF